jgi:hypothetical protein
MPFLHYSDIETQKSQITSYLGLNQVNNCRRILNTWLNTTAASVGLDLDSSELWAMLNPEFKNILFGVLTKSVTKRRHAPCGFFLGV